MRGYVDFQAGLISLAFDDLHFFCHLRNNEKNFTSCSECVQVFIWRHLSCAQMRVINSYVFDVYCMLPFVPRALEHRTSSYCKSYTFLRLYYVTCDFRFW